MLTTFFTFMFRTKIGNAIGIALIVLACWYGFRWYYMREGAEACQRQKASEIATANAVLIEGERKRDSTSNTVAAETRESTEKAKQEVTDSSTKKKEVIRDAYRAPNNQPAVALGSCAYPVPKRVQQSLDAAVKQANDATR